MLNKDDGIFLPSIEGVVSGKTSQVAGMNDILNKLIGNDNYLDKRKMSTENTIEDLKKSKKYKLGDVVDVLGFHTKGDGSHHLRIAKDVDDGSGEVGVDGLIWCILHSGEVNVSWFGAKGDFDYVSYNGSDSSAFFEKAINYCARNYSTELVIDGLFYISKTIITKNPIIMKGRSVPCRPLLSNSDNPLLTFNKPSSGIAVADNTIAIVMEGYGTTTQKDARIFLEKIKFFGKSRTSTFIHSKVFGAPARPLVIRDCEGEAFKDFLVIENPSSDNLGTNYYSSSFSNNNFYYCENFIRTIIDGDLQGLGGFSIKDSTIEQGCGIKIKNLMGYGEIKNCLLEGSPNTIDIKLHSNASLNIEGVYFEKNSGVNVINSVVGGYRNTLNFSYCFDLNSTHTFNISDLKVRMVANKIKDACIFERVNFIEKDFTLKNSQINQLVTSNVGRIIEIKPNTYYDTFRFDSYTDTIDNIKVSKVKAGTSAQANRNINGLVIGEYIVAQFFNAGKSFNCEVSFVDLQGNGGYVDTPTVTIPANNFVTIRLPLIKNITGTSIGLSLSKISEDTYLSGGYYSLKNADLFDDFLCSKDIDLSFYSLFTQLDTPYYTRKMEEEGIYEDFVDYMDSLNANPLTRPSEPKPSERLLKFAKRYNIN
ncbi:MAG: hypothetical protein ACRCXT_18410 [Paraclostridium sp.]